MPLFLRWRSRGSSRDRMAGKGVASTAARPTRALLPREAPVSPNRSRRTNGRETSGTHALRSGPARGLAANATRVPAARPGSPKWRGVFMRGRSLCVVGAPGSPYSRKLRAVLRYRRIPYVWVQRGSREASGLPKPRVELLPQLILPAADGTLEALIDSTPLIRRLETLEPGRSVIPPDPALAFLDALLEDYADEWLTKAMFHYRWAYAADVA